MLCRTTLFAVSLVALAGQVNAQSTTSQSAPAAAAPAPAYYPGYYGHSSTLQEGVQHGYADVLRAEGEMMYNLGRTANQFEEAHDKARENHARDVDQYFALRERNKQYQQAQHSKSTTKTVAQKKASPVKAKVSKATVSVVRYDGQIEWPAALANLSSDARGQVEKVFARRAKGHDVKSGSQEHSRASGAIEKLQGELKGSIQTIPSSEYLSAKKALDSLKSQLTQPVDQNLLTQN